MEPSVVGNSEAIRLAQASDWKGLQRLLEREPGMAQKPGDHDMLPIHWACTVRRVPLSLIAKLLQAYPDGVQAKNSGELLPLHIAIRARVQASCLRKLLRAYPEAIHERTPDGVTALEMANDLGLDADSMKVLYRAHECRSNFQQHHDDNSNEYENADYALNRVISAQEEGEASGIARFESEESNQKLNNWSDNITGSERNGKYTGFFHVMDDGELHSTLEPENSISMMSEQSLSEMDGLDSPHDHLVSPSSSSSYSHKDRRTSLGSPSSFEDRFYSGSRRGLVGFPRQNQDPTRQQAQLCRTMSLLTPVEDYTMRERELKTMVSAISANPAMVMTEEDEARRHNSRHQSLPLIPNHGNLRRNSSLPLHHRSDDEYEQLRDCTSPAAVAPLQPQSRPFQSGHESMPSQHSVARGGSQRSSPIVTRKTHRRASHDSHGHGRFDPPPEWKHDGECSICRASFGMFKHRHHCRNCGKSICSQHSADKKILMEAKGFTTPQRVCVTCYAMITHSRSLKHDLEPDDVSREDSIVDCSPYHASTNTDRHFNAVAAFPSSSTLGLSRHGTVLGSARSPMSVDECPIFSPSKSRRVLPGKSSVIAAGEATGGAGERATHGPGPTSPVHELRCLLASQQKQIEQLAQSNMQMQQQLLEQEELKAETMLLITQLMTRVSVLELQKDRSFFSSKRRSAETGESEDEDEDYPQDDSLRVDSRLR